MWSVCVCVCVWGGGGDNDTSDCCCYSLVNIDVILPGKNRENAEQFMVVWSTHFFVSGTNPRDVRPVAPRIYSNTTDSSRCPFEAYKRYRAFRPAEMNDPDAPFYLAVNWGRQDVIRYKCNALGQNTLYSMLRRMVSAAGIADDRRLTNHSAREFLIQKLSDLNIDSNHIKQVSGHKSVESITNYAHLNSKQQETISDVFVDPTARGSRDHDLHALALPAPSSLANQARSSVLARPASPQRSLALGWQASHSLSSRSESAGQFVGCTFAGPVTVNYITRPAKRARVIDSDYSQ